MFEVHDCFSITELITMEDLYISPEGGAVKDIMDGFYDADGEVPCPVSYTHLTLPTICSV